MIICITPNAAVDRTLLFDSLVPGTVHRATERIAAAGGKGINVARSLKILGAETLAMGPLGGHSGRFIAEQVEKEAIPAKWTWHDQETRTCAILVHDGGRSTVINEPGFVDPAAWRRMIMDVTMYAGEGATLICISGSMPDNPSDTAPADLINAIKQTGIPVWTDTSGIWLRRAIEAKSDGIKVNAEELAAVMNREISGAKDAVDAGFDLCGEGIQHVVVTLGADGAVFVNKSGGYWARSPEVEIVSAVGSGDAMLAGFIDAFARDLTPDEALRNGVAAGTVNAMVAGGGLFTRDAFDAMRAQVIVDKLR